MRVQSDWPAQRGMGGYFHRLSTVLTPAPEHRPRPQRTAFDSRRQATVSDWIIRSLELDRLHEGELQGRRRQLSPEQIDRRGYRTWPSHDARVKLAALARAEFGPLLDGYPGFYYDRSGQPQFAGPEGMLLPVRNERGAIAGFQIRPDDEGRPKRIWLSSAGRRGGMSSGAPPHWSFPNSIEDPFTLYVVEGVLSADICSDKLGSPVIGISGKTNWRAIPIDRLGEELIERVVIALDQDDAAKRTEDDAQALAEAIGDGFEVKFARWNGARAKGLDDCLNRRLRFHIY